MAPMLMRSLAPTTRVADALPGRAPNALPAIPNAAPNWAARCANCRLLIELSSTRTPSFESRQNLTEQIVHLSGFKRKYGQLVGKDYARKRRFIPNPLLLNATTERHADCRRWPRNEQERSCTNMKTH